MKIKVVYEGGKIDSDLDARIRKGLESVGLRWYGQGMDLTTGERDMGFDTEAKATHNERGE